MFKSLSMNKIFTVLAGCLLLSASQSFAQRTCGAQLVKESIIARHPEAREQIEKQRRSLQGIADQYKLEHAANLAMKTTAVSAVPVVFHIVVNTAQFAELGGNEGIARRCDSQIAVLNRDYNRGNGDSTAIPASFKPLYASVGIAFGLAHKTPSGAVTPGYEIKIISDNGFDGSDSSYTKAKHNITNGLDAWDVTRYLNIWCINFLDFPGLIGLTVSPSFADSGWNRHEDLGVALLYNVLGSRSASSDSYPANFDRGRSLTHEIGHFFEIWHPWGDDGGLCPPPGPGSDDGIADTPPEGNNASGSPTGPVFDACSTSGAGVMWMNYMDYCNDDAVHMFTIDQAAVMAAQVAPGGESYLLTQNPSIVAVPASEVLSDLNIFPNPSSGTLNLTFNSSKDELLSVHIIDMAGRDIAVKSQAAVQKDFYSIDLSGMSKGIYFVRCNFASGSITRKIVLQ